MFSACVAAVKCRPVLYHCVVIFFWSSGIMEWTCMLFTFENGVPLMRKGASVVWHQSLPLMYSFDKTEAAFFSCRLCFLRAFPFISLMQLQYDRYTLCPHKKVSSKVNFRLQPTGVCLSQVKHVCFHQI